MMPGVNIHAEVTEIGGEKDLELGLQKAIDAKDSVGGVVECRVSGLPATLGEPFSILLNLISRTSLLLFQL